MATSSRAQPDQDTIIIGADVTHPGTGAHDGTPSIAAVVGNVDDEFMQYPGSMRLQRSRKEFIIELGDMVKERLIDWAEKHKNRLPTRMLFYRDGVSDSQYEKLREFEIPQIKKAFNWAKEYLNYKGSPNFAPNAILDYARNPWPTPMTATTVQDRENEKFADNTGLDVKFELTYVVVGKRHNTRFYPLASDSNNTIAADNRGNPNGNVKPGLVVDTVITHPRRFEFFLQSQKPLAGTGRSAHYVVLTNEMNLDLHELEHTTLDLCYIYARSTTGVSYCAPAYYADRLCDRGRTYLRHWLIQEDAIKPTRGRKTKAIPPETVPEYHDFVKNELRDLGYYRPTSWPGLSSPIPVKYGFHRRNPWHENFDGTMFYL